MIKRACFQPECGHHTISWWVASQNECFLFPSCSCRCARLSWEADTELVDGKLNCFEAQQRMLLVVVQEELCDLC